jgi:hypothetical protein
MQLTLKFPFFLLTLLISSTWLEECYSFQSSSVVNKRMTKPSFLKVSELEKIDQTSPLKIKNSNQKHKNAEILDPSTYESMLLRSWDVDPSIQRGFDWEIEKLRRFFAGLRQLDDGTWVKRQSVFDFLVSKAEFFNSHCSSLGRASKTSQCVGCLCDVCN